MAYPIRTSMLFVAALALTLPASAQTRDGLMGDIADVQSKIVGLAKAMPEGTGRV